MNRSEQLDLMREVALAPSIHNVQPTRWHFFGQDGVALCGDKRVDCPAADPSQHDRKVSFGCSFEGMQMALSKRGLQLVPHEASVSLPPEYEVVSVYRLSPLTSGVMADERYVSMRKSYRGVFAKVEENEKSRALTALRALAHVKILSEKSEIETMAKLHDKATGHFMKDRSYLVELYSWMRFSPAHPQYAIDGLNAEAMALPAPLAFMASLILKPSVYSFLDKLGIGEALVSEGAQTKSALGILLFKANRNESPFEIGRQFYRTWLGLAKAGVNACPMSSSIDYSETRREVEKLAALTSEERLVNVLRFGFVPKKHKMQDAARVSPERLLI